MVASNNVTEQENVHRPLLWRRPPAIDRYRLCFQPKSATTDVAEIDPLDNYSLGTGDTDSSSFAYKSAEAIALARAARLDTYQAAIQGITALVEPYAGISESFAGVLASIDNSSAMSATGIGESFGGVLASIERNAAMHSSFTSMSAARISESFAGVLASIDNSAAMHGSFAAMSAARIGESFAGVLASIDNIAAMHGSFAAMSAAGIGESFAGVLASIDTSTLVPNISSVYTQMSAFSSLLEVKLPTLSTPVTRFLGVSAGVNTLLESLKDTSWGIPEEVQEELDEIFILGEQESFEEADETEFSRALLAFIEKHGTVGVDAIDELVEEGSFKISLISEALTIIGEAKEPSSYQERLELLARNLNAPSTRIRYGAMIGLSLMNDPQVIPFVKSALAEESVSILQGILEQLLEHLTSQVNPGAE